MTGAGISWHTGTAAATRCLAFLHPHALRLPHVLYLFPELAAPSPYAYTTAPSAQNIFEHGMVTLCGCVPAHTRPRPCGRTWISTTGVPSRPACRADICGHKGGTMQQEF